MKTCSSCGEKKSLSEFSILRATRTGNEKYRNAYCKMCRSEKGRDWYAKQDCKIKRAATRRANQKATAKILSLLREYLESHPCINCGESDIVVLEFDHREANQIRITIGTLARRTRSWRRVFEEIQKCDVRCANCHLRRHAHENNSWRLEQT